MTPPVIQTEGLTKYYGRSRGIIDVHLQVEQGEIFGFLGPNGAGKTTTIRLLLDLIRPSRGRARVLGLDPQKDGVEVRRRVGYLPGELALYSDLTGQQVLEYAAHLRNTVPQKEITRLADRLEADLKRPIRTLSHGNRQKIGLIMAMMHRPELLILDEPTTGLDPLMQQVLYELLEEVRRDGRTVFFSSHILPEVERLCDRIGILREGRVVAVESVSGLKEVAIRRMDLVFESPVDPEPFRAIPGVREVSAAGATLHIAIQGSLDPLIKVAAQHPVRNIVTYEPNLEEAFLAFYRREDGGQATAP
ncbi:MAG: ABC transporter ATP-binding protein [Anaerolineae bacterium]|nr:ABC transporter ATP-binding protein [Anaerolineae bacterium]MDW8069354.1 ABC transporter ATP-binding protein [Anaerolineae bacterium]